jgi:hypothetical protein
VGGSSRLRLGNLSEEGWAEVAWTLLGLDIGVEAGLGSVMDAEMLAGGGLAARCLRVLIEVPQEDPGEAVAAATAIDRALEGAGISIPRLHHGEGPATWAVLEAAIREGRDIRVGLEDTLVLPDGRPALGNEELVRGAMTLARGAE